jgi:hypothetical protein
MLNRDQLLELGRFKLMMRRVCAESVHIERFLEDAAYQSHLLDMAEEADDDELLMLSLTLRSRLGRLGDGEAEFYTIRQHQQVGRTKKDAAMTAYQTAPLSDATAMVDEIPERASVGSRTLPMMPALSRQALQSSVDAAPPRQRGLLGSLFGRSQSTTTGSNETNAPRYIASLR